MADIHPAIAFIIAGTAQPPGSLHLAFTQAAA